MPTRCVRYVGIAVSLLALCGCDADEVGESDVGAVGLPVGDAGWEPAESELFDERLGLHVTVPDGWQVAQDRSNGIRLRRVDDPPGSGGVELRFAGAPSPGQRSMAWDALGPTQLFDRPARMLRAAAGPNWAFVARVEHDGDALFVEGDIRGALDGGSLAARQTELDAALEGVRLDVRL